MVAKLLLSIPSVASQTSLDLCVLKVFIGRNPRFLRPTEKFLKSLSRSTDFPIDVERVECRHPR